MSSRIYKICPQAEWNAALAAGSYAGSPDDLRDGFIHFSFADQVHATVAKYFTGRTDLLLIEVDATQLGPALRHEPARNGALFPHLYAPLPLHAAVSVNAYRIDSQIAAYATSVAGTADVLDPALEDAGIETLLALDE